MVQPSWVGRRVTVRRVLEREPSGRVLFGDVVGDLVSLDAQTVVVETRRHLVEVPLALISIAKLVPPSAAEELALEDVVARGWRAEQTEPLGGWLLRATDGFTGRANSVLPLKAPGLELDPAIERVRQWYAQRALPARFQVPTESRRLLDAALGERGWEPSPDVHVMTGRLDVLRAGAPAPADPGDGVSLQTRPDESWFRRYRDGRGAVAPARALLVRHDQVVFAAIADPDADADATPAAIGRGTIDDGWLGVTAVEVAAVRRRQGLAQAIMRALWAWGVEHGARRSHLEVQVDNTAALGLYDNLGYRTHHDYRYRTDPNALTAHA